MLNRLDYSDPDFYPKLNRLLRSDAENDGAVEKAVRAIITGVRQNGDAAVMQYTRDLDGGVCSSVADLELTADVMDKCYARIDDGLRGELESAASRIRSFHEKEMGHSWSFTEEDGTMLGQIVNAVDKAGVYVPGGKAAYPSSVLMTAVPAKVAGVNEIIMTVPAVNGEVDDVVIAAAKIAGVDRIFTIGGAQAIAALAYGTETIPAVDKIAGPGNVYVAAAKKAVYGDVGVDMVAGPSEVVVICDESADMEWAVMDLLAQAEHDELAQSILITSRRTRTDELSGLIDTLLRGLEREDIIKASLKNNGAIIQVENLDQAVEISNHIAPEHLELMVDDASDMLNKIRHAGAIFVGRYSAEVLGDYCAGPNHVLPTSGTARFGSPLGVCDFQKRSSVIHASAEGADKMAKTAARLAHSEGLTAHQRAAMYRVKN